MNFMVFFLNFFLLLVVVFLSLNVVMVGLGLLLKRCMFIWYFFIGFLGLLFLNYRKCRKFLWLGFMWKEWNICLILYIMVVVFFWSELGFLGDCLLGLGWEVVFYLGKCLSIWLINWRLFVFVLVFLGYKC